MQKSVFCYFLSLLLLQCSLSQKRQLPVIDMHLHAEHIKKKQGQAPVCIGSPFRDLGITDPRLEYSKVFDSALKTNAWADKFLASPGTDDSLRQLTIDALKKYNVYGVTSGDIETVRKWQAASPDRIIPAIYWDFN